MPLHHIHTWRAGAIRPGRAGLIVLLLSGCMGMDGLPQVGMFNSGDGIRPGGVSTEMQVAADQAEQRSAIIDDLLSRQSVLPQSGAFADVAGAVLAASAGAAEAELRVARLKAEAKSKNWLPSIGPSVNLTSLSSLATSLLVEAVIFDNGQRKAERAYAAADVEIAAVNLSADINDRVHDGLSYYIKAQRAREQAGLAEIALARMNEYDRIMQARVEGGLSDRSEQRVLMQKVSEIRAAHAADQQDVATAMAELHAITETDLTGLTGIQDIGAMDSGPEPLAVLKARGEGAQLVAEAKMERAAHLPGLKASASIGKGGLEGGLRLGADRLLGLGTGAQLAALEATGDVVDRRAADAAQDANRRIVALEQDYAALASRQATGASVLAEAEASLDMFTEQYKVGRRPLMELVGMFEDFSGMERLQAALKYDMALIRVQIARERGVLVDGARM